MDKLRPTLIKIKAIHKELWPGKVPLAQAFWLYFFASIAVLKLIERLIGPVAAVIAVVWAGYMVMPILRSAYRHRGKPLYALMAKIFVVLTALGLFVDLFA